MVDRIKVIGVGNPDRGDDGVGPAVAAGVAASDPELEVAVSTSDPSRLLEAWSDADRVVLVDAVVDGSRPGTVSVIDVADGSIPPDVASTSSHGMGVAAALDLARALDRLPDRVVVVGITAESFEGDRLTDRVDAAVTGAVRTVMEEVRRA